MVEHAVTVAGRRVRCDSFCVTGSDGADAIVPSFDEEWDELATYAVFERGGISVNKQWDGSTPIEVPSALMAQPGWIALSFYGVDDGGQVVNTVACKRAIAVAKGGPTSVTGDAGGSDLLYATPDEVVAAFDAGYEGE